MKNILMILICLSIIFTCSGCSITFSLKSDGENWSIGIGGEVPQIPMIDYEKNIND